MHPIPVSVVVMTKNESRNIRKCLATLKQFAEVFVVDSGSTDDTTTVAAELGAKVVDFRWNGRYPKKKQWCLEHLPFKNDWVLYVDADEEVTEPLADEIRSTLSDNNHADGYFVSYHYRFMGRTLEHGHKVQKLVLFNRHRGRFVDYDDLDVSNMWEVEGHYQPIIDGSVGMLKSPMLHADHDDLYHYFDRHNRYSDWESTIRAKGLVRSSNESQFGVRSKLKPLFDAMPGKPFVAFAHSYLLKQGFRDGRAGLDFAAARAFYYWQIGLKSRERAESQAVNDLPPLSNYQVFATMCCPVCHAALTWSDAAATCSACAASYRIEDGIPVMLPAAADDAHKATQVEYYDEETDPEFESTRPHGAPAMYQRLLAEKFARGVDALGSLAGKTALTVCGGSGMDAEFLARRGAIVIASDISLGAAKRTRERAERYGVSIFPIVADVEHLPFAGRSVDLVYVHDGLHHLTDPFIGLREMARVAKHAVSVTEPAQAGLTQLAVKLRLAQEIEDAGNRVERLQPETVAAVLAEQGLQPKVAARYAMYYKHRPGPVMRALSLPVLHQFAWLGWRTANALIGRYGNKMTVQSTRPNP